jgi:stringent starvation protein B
VSELQSRHRSTKPYLIRAIYDWCTDHRLTPYLAVRVDEWTRVPMAYVKDGEIVLNLSADAVHHLRMGNDEITFGARFGGVPHEIIVPLAAVIGIFAKETGQGLVFEGGEPELAPPEPEGEGPDKGGGPPHLRVVK